METIHYYEISTLDGTRYGIQAINFDGQFSPQIDRLDANGEPTYTIIDATETDEIYDDVRTCLQRAIAHVI